MNVKKMKQKTVNAFWGKASGKENDEDDDETRDDEDEYEEEEAGICLYKSPYRRSQQDPNRIPIRFRKVHTPNPGNASVPFRASRAAPYP